MRRIGLPLLAGLLVAWCASAQTSGSVQTGASAQSKTSVKAGKSGAQVQSQNSASASQQANVSREQSGKKDSGAQASGSGSAAGSTSAGAQAGPNSASLASGTTIEAVLASSLDARKNKEGDQVMARTAKAVKSNGQVIIPKGAKLLGHVTQAKARAEGQSESSLGIRFDRALLKDGREIPLNVVIQAVAAAETAASSSFGEEGMAPASTMGSTATSGSGGVASSGGVLGGVGSTVGAATGAVAHTAGAAVGATAETATSATGTLAGTHAAGALTSSSNGVVGLKGLSLNSEASSATQGSLLVSSTRNVRLDSGTRMLLRAQAQSQ